MKISVIHVTLPLKRISDYYLGDYFFHAGIIHISANYGSHPGPTKFYNYIITKFYQGKIAKTLSTSSINEKKNNMKWITLSTDLRKVLLARIA